MRIPKDSSETFSPPRVPPCRSPAELRMSVFIFRAASVRIVMTLLRLPLLLIATATWSCCSAAAHSRGSRVPPPSHSSDADAPLHDSYSRCASLGFVPGELACSTCAVIHNALSDATETREVLLSDCANCCSPALDFASPAKYEVAVLEFNSGSLGAFGGVKEFMEKDGVRAYRGALEVVDGGVCV